MAGINKKIMNLICKRIKHRMFWEAYRIYRSYYNNEEIMNVVKKFSIEPRTLNDN